MRWNRETTRVASKLCKVPKIQIAFCKAEDSFALRKSPIQYLFTGALNRSAIPSGSSNAPAKE
jgi:hypothetical protein